MDPVTIATLGAVGNQALGGIAGGIGKYIAGKDEEKEKRKAALRELYNSQISDPRMKMGTPIEKAPGAFETIALPAVQGTMSSLAQRYQKGLDRDADEYAKVHG